jgi:phage shock protein A
MTASLMGLAWLGSWIYLTGKVEQKQNDDINDLTIQVQQLQQEIKTFRTQHDELIQRQIAIESKLDQLTVIHKRR